MKLTLLLCTFCCAAVQFPSRQRTDFPSDRFRSSYHQRPESIRYRFPIDQNPPEASSFVGSQSQVLTRRDTEELTTQTRGVVFPGPWEVKNTKGTTQFDDTTARSHASLNTNNTNNERRNCSVLDFNVFYPATGKCEKLLERGPCGKDQWLILRSPTENPVCSLRPCVRGFSNSGGNCTTEVRCHFDKSPFVTRQGDVLCLCDAGTVLWKEDGRCYKLFGKGPCPANSHLVLDAFDEPVCMINPCNKEGVVPYQAPDTHNCIECHQLNTQGPCLDGYVFMVDVATLKPRCVSAEVALDIRQLLRTAAFRCPAGTFRSYSRSCKRGTAVKDYRTAFFG